MRSQMGRIQMESDIKKSGPRTKSRKKSKRRKVVFWATVFKFTWTFDI